MASCGGGSGADPSMAGASRDEVVQACQDMYAEVDLCDAWFGTADEWKNGCIDYLDSVRRDYVSMLVECWKQATCASLDSCFDSAAAGLEPLEVADAYGEACREKAAECGASAAEVAAWCDVDDINRFSTEAVSEMTSCFDEPCEAIASCLDAKLD